MKLVLELKVLNNETDNTLKQSFNDCVKTSATENEYNKFYYNRSKWENPDYQENKIKIDEMKQL